jgi:L-threonylcarbamoyladenylate synthase
MTIDTATAVENAVLALKQGRLVAFPTETVYGLGADAENLDALNLLYATKGRPPNHPVIVHLAPSAQLDDWAENIPEAAYRLAEAFWPGPLTLILSRAARVPNAVTGGQNTVGLRIPAHPVAQQLLEAFDGGVAGPSANRFGRLSPTTAEHVRADLGDAVDCILDGGACPVGVESTIVAFQNGEPVVLRPGMITPKQLETTLSDCLISTAKPAIASTASKTSTHTTQTTLNHSKITSTETTQVVSADKQTTISRAPGTLARHYAPQTPLSLLSSKELKETLLQRQHDRNPTVQKHIGVLAWKTPNSSIIPVNCLWVEASSNPEVYARELYAHLRMMDESHLDALYVEAVPDTDEWAAIADRLRRAAHPDI